MKNLRNQGRASDEAVKDAEINLAMSVVNYELALLQQARALASSAATAAAWGFYADMRLDTSTSKSTANTNAITNTASNITSNNGNIILTANSSTPTNYTDETNLTEGSGNITQKGSNITASNGSIDYTATNNLNITASKDTYNYTFGSETTNASIVLSSTNPADMAISSVTGSLGYQKSDQKTNSINYNNSKTTANNITINITNDTDIIGANLLATNDLNITTGNDLNIQSLQNELHSKGKTQGLNIGGGSGGGGSASFGFNYGKNRTDRIWVDNQTTLIANNSVIINTGNNTNIKGALIANQKTDNTDGGNLNITTKSLTYSDIYDIEESSSSNVGTQVSGLGEGGNTASNSNQQSNQYPEGNLTLTVQNSGYTKEQITRATIGQGTIAITNNSDITNLNRDIKKAQEITRDTIDHALDVEVAIDIRLLDPSGNGQKEILGEIEDMAGNLLVIGGGIATTTKDLITSLNTNEDDPSNDSYSEAFANKQELRRNAIFNTAGLLKEGETATYYNDSNDNKEGFYNKETGETFVNLAYVNDNESLTSVILHESYHENSNLSKTQEETLAHNYQENTSNLINFYHNQGDQTNSSLSQLVSWGYANSSVGDDYNQSNNYVNNLYGNNTQNVNSVNIAVNNYKVRNVNPDDIETDVAFQLEKGGRSKFGHLSGYFQKGDGAWIRYDQGVPGNVKTSPLILLNKGYEQGIRTSADDKYSSDYLIKRDDVVYIRSTKEQDAKILENVIEQIYNMDNSKYRLWTNNCVDSFTNACSGTGIDLPSNITARPDKYFEKLKKMYPDNNTNKAY